MTSKSLQHFGERQRPPHNVQLAVELAVPVTIIGGSCRKYNFCCNKSMLCATKVLSQQAYFCPDKQVFLATKHVFCSDKIMLVATKLLSRQKFCCGKHTFVVTKFVFCRDKIRVCRDKNYTYNSSRQWYMTSLTAVSKRPLPSTIRVNDLSATL